jgi:outer membrane protein OmpA-like peptidoglycan-associated protein
MIRTIAALAFTAFASFAASAQTTVHYREGQQVDPGDVARILTTGKAIKTRSLRLLSDSASPAQKPDPAPAALSLPVRFAFGSAEITPSARPQLDALAEGIKLLPPGQSVVIEGHTDAVGSDDFNLLLSHRRARAVKDYLVRAHGIDELRLKETGFGKGQPIAGLDPLAAENRRVEFRGS